MTLFDELFSYKALQQILSDESRIESMLRFEAALARAEARTGVIPEGAAHRIAAECHAKQFDLAAIAKQAALAGHLAIPLARM